MGNRRRRFAVVGGTAVLGVLAAGGAAYAVAPAGVAQANPREPGHSYPNLLSRNLDQVEVARGSYRLENPSGAVQYFGYLNDGPMLPAPGTTTEATKTEPDKNTYLVLRNQPGADATYNYGTRFLFQGHEAGSPGSITRINLDADARHRVTLMATTDSTGTPLPTFDGSTWDPFAKRLLFTSERGTAGGVWQATTGLPSLVEDVSGALGRGGYEGVQNDSLGNVYLVEDVGGPTGTANPNARQPNSYVYKFVPNNRYDLRKGGRLQVLQVTSPRGGPILFHPGQADADILSRDLRDLHSYGKSFRTTWVTIHDTAKDGMTPFDANALAKPVGTPFKRPENGVFKPGSGFRQFFFTETGDTDLGTQAGREYGGFGGIFRLIQDSPGSDTGVLRLFYLGDPAHTGFDNIQFAGANRLVVVEDAGDKLHGQRNALDSGYLLDTGLDYRKGRQPVRWLAEGRDPSATVDSGLAEAKTPGFQNDGDNEITGIHISDGDPTPAGILGAKVPVGFTSGAWATFWTQQHGDNVVYRVVPKVR